MSKRYENLLSCGSKLFLIMKRLIITVSIILFSICIASCTKSVDTSVSLSGTEWIQTNGNESTVELSFSDIEFSLTYTVHKKTENYLPGEGYRIKGSYVYESPEAILYCRTIEFLFNGAVESVDTFGEEFNAVIVDDVLSLYIGHNSGGTFSRRK